MPKKRGNTSPGSGPKLLSGGNPQIPKGDGDAPVQAYIAAMPAWKSDVGRRLDGLIEQTVPDVVKAVRWNQPMYGVEDGGFFVSFRCFTEYIKLTFFAGARLDPVPPVDFKDPNEKAFHIHEDDELDQELLTRWFEQAAAIPGWTP
ncbi:MAG TPA: DUF1801 domain-containing protein [Egicoccus sp.]|nr:DUF1801 domain-containing protein [Egicoccus sp.]HSK21962.1 DUF1801 domain-containing protein [Egicoccus sp.]